MDSSWRGASLRSCTGRLESYENTNIFIGTEMAPPVFYHMPLSPVSRGGLLVARMLNVEVEVRNVDLFTKEHLKPEYLKLNPMHTVPTLDDNGFVVVDSHAIATYLASKYGKDEKLYPKDVNKRSVVDQRLHFDNGTLFKRLRDVAFSVFFLGADTISADLKKNAYEALDWLEGYLKSTEWVAGDHITIADALCVANVTTYVAMGFDLNKYPQIKAWVANCKKSIPDFETVNEQGTDAFHVAFKSKLKPGEI
ncbi:Glutathione S-transferase D7 [Gryllus bimaculatus]|nr:Glutathione S-transferase D7 [Gryllus bimaculatus]